jgi:hypothetical protein
MPAVGRFGDKSAERENFRPWNACRSAEVFLRMSVKTGFSTRSKVHGERWTRTDWRREWDSNPRYGFPYTRFPSERLQPLGHLSKVREPICEPCPRTAQYSGGPPPDNPTMLVSPAPSRGTISTPHRCQNVHEATNEDVIGRGLLLWLLGIPLPIILLIWVLGGLHG